MWTEGKAQGLKGIMPKQSPSDKWVSCVHIIQNLKDEMKSIFVK
jgi:hypothetical protein